MEHGARFLILNYPYTRVRRWSLTAHFLTLLPYVYEDTAVDVIDELGLTRGEAPAATTTATDAVIGECAQWQKGNGVVMSPLLASLPRMKLTRARSAYWRHRPKGKGGVPAQAEGCSSIEALWFVCQEVHPPPQKKIGYSAISPRQRAC